MCIWACCSLSFTAIHCSTVRRRSVGSFQPVVQYCAAMLQSANERSGSGNQTQGTMGRPEFSIPSNHPQTRQCAVWAQDAPINGPDAGLWGVTQAHFRPQWDPQYLQGLQLYFKEKGIHNFIFWAYNANGSAHQSSRLFFGAHVRSDNASQLAGRSLCLAEPCRQPRTSLISRRPKTPETSSCPA